MGKWLDDCEDDNKRLRRQLDDAQTEVGMWRMGCGIALIVLFIILAALVALWLW